MGNLQAGGAGKTPLTAQIAREAIQKGLQVCILSRGYRGRLENEGGVILPGQKDVDPKIYGDEPALLHELVPGATLIVGKNRLQNFQKFSGRFDWVILDDGFQHWKIKKDLEILALTSLKPSEVIFRESFSAIQYADLIVWTKGESAPDFKNKPWVQVEFKLRKRLEITPIWLVTGIAHPEYAIQSAKEAGYKVLRQISRADHQDYHYSEIEMLLSQAGKASVQVATTGKDWVKWKSLGLADPDVIVLEPEIIFKQGHEQWSKALWEK